MSPTTVTSTLSDAYLSGIHGGIDATYVVEPLGETVEYPLETT